MKLVIVLLFALTSVALGQGKPSSHAKTLGAKATAHSATLTIVTQSASSGVTGNNIYRSNTAGGPYTLIQGCGLALPLLVCIDHTVVAGATYFYVATALCPTCAPKTESGFSNEVKAIIPTDAPPTPNPPVLGTPVQVAANPPTVQLAWKVSTAPNVTAQFVARQVIGSTGWIRQIQFKPTATAYTDKTGLRRGKRYAYQVQAVTKNAVLVSKASPPILIH